MARTIEVPGATPLSLKLYFTQLENAIAATWNSSKSIFQEITRHQSKHYFYPFISRIRCTQDRLNFKKGTIQSFIISNPCSYSTMNLLTDKWIPIIHDNQFQFITLENVLCQKQNWQLSFHRDDMELAARQLMICLVQVIFTPKDKDELKQRVAQPLTPDEYQTGLQNYLELFDLNHPTHPFMQTRGVKAEKITPIQKLFIGLPEGNNHAFFNEVGEMSAVPAAWVAIALFNQASNCPSFGGGFKGSLRGEAPITTLIQGKTLREMLWFNVLTQDNIKRFLFPAEQDIPVWREPIKKDSTIYAHQIGLLRGLFWQPAHVELFWHQDKTCEGFNKEKFTYTIEGLWAHPHSPRIIETKQGKKKERFLSFKNMAPAWTQLSQFLSELTTKKGGHIPAAVVTQYREIFRDEPLNLLVGGYRNKQASVLQRRHEILSLAAGWTENMEMIQEFIEIALKMKTLLTGALFGFSKTAGLPNLSPIAEERFYQDSEVIIHGLLQCKKFGWRERKDAREDLFKELEKVVTNLFDEITRPYQHEPKMLKALAIQKRKLYGALKKENPQA